MWSGPKGASVQERLDRQVEAKKALLDRFKKQPGPGDKEYEERQAELVAIAEAAERKAREEAEFAALEKVEADARRMAIVKEQREARKAAKKKKKRGL
jgi:hypothetical protein